MRGVDWERNIQSVIAITHWTGQNLGGPSLHCIQHLPGAHSETIRVRFKQNHRRIILRISWFTLFSWKSPWKLPCSRLPNSGRSSGFHDRQVTRETHTRGLFMWDILSSSPPKGKVMNYFPKPIVCFRAFIFMKANVTPNTVMNSFWMPVQLPKVTHPAFTERIMPVWLEKAWGSWGENFRKQSTEWGRPQEDGISTEEHPGKAKTSQLGYILCKRGLRKEASVSCSPVLPSGQTHQEDNLKCLWGRAGREEGTSVSWKLPRSVTRVPPTSCPCVHLMCS